MNRVQRNRSVQEFVAEVYGRALAAGLWDGREPLRPCDLAARLPPGFFRSSAEAAAFGREGFAARQAAAPCDLRPGSGAKLDVLAARVDAGESLWHPLDIEIEAWHEGRCSQGHHGDTEEEESSQGDRERQPGRRKIGGHHTKALAEE